MSKKIEVGDNDLVVVLRGPESDQAPTSATCRVLVGDKQIGLISSFDLNIEKDKEFPEVTVRFLEGMSEEVFSTCSDRVQTSLREYGHLLRRFPYVQVEKPGSVKAVVSPGLAPRSSPPGDDDPDVY